MKKQKLGRPDSSGLLASDAIASSEWRVASFIRNLLFQLPILKFTVQEESMLPTLAPGDAVLVWRFGKPKVGDIVVAHPKGVITMGPAIKRVGKIRNGRYFLVGDNHAKSTDSRQFGWVNRKEVVGRMIN